MAKNFGRFASYFPRYPIRKKFVRKILTHSVFTFPGGGSASRVLLGEYEFDLRAGELRHGEHKTILQTQPHKILLMLVEQPGEVITRDEIQRQLWQDNVIVNFEVGINQAMSKLRRALNDSAAVPRLIETVGRRGYRLMVSVTVSPQPTQSAPPGGTPTLDQPLPELLAGIVEEAYAKEERKMLTTALLKLLNALADLDPALGESSGT